MRAQSLSPDSIRCQVLVAISALSIAVCLCTPASGARGYARVQNGTLVADNGELLRGVFYDPDTTGVLPAAQTIIKMREFGFNTLHVYGEKPCGSRQPGYKLNEIKALRNITRDNGLYMILTIGHDCAPSVVPIPNSTSHEHINYDTDFSVAFWELYADLFKNDTHVVFEITNEPYWVQTAGPFGDDVYSQNPPAAVIDLQARGYDAIRDILGSTPTPVLLFSYGGFRDGNGAKNDWARVNTALTAFRRSLDANTAVAFHTYGSGPIGSIESAVQAARSGSNGLALINTEVQRGGDIVPGECLVSGVPSAAPCLLKEQHKLWEEEELSAISFLKLDRIVGGQSVGDLLTDDDYRRRVVAQMEANSPLIWVPDHPTATWPAQRAPASWCGSTLSLQWVNNGKWVRPGFDNILRAEASAPSGSTQLRVACRPDGKVWLQPAASASYIDPDWTNPSTPLTVGGSSPGVAQEFDLLLRENGVLVLRSRFATGHPGWRIVTANSSSKKLFNNQTLLVNSARFDFEILLNDCTPPPSGDWQITTSCTFEGNATAPANVFIDNAAVLTIGSGATLDLDFAQHQLLVKSGSQVLVKAGGTIH